MKKVLCMVLSLLFILSISGCAAKVEAKPEDAVKGYIDAAKLMDNAGMNKFINPKNATADTSSANGEYEKMFIDYLKTNAKKLTYTIKGSEITGDSAVVTVDCKYVDGTQLFKDTMTEYISKAMASALSGSQPTEEEAGKEIAKIMTEKQKTAKEVTAEKTVKVKCVKISGKWLVDEAGEDLENVLSSNLMTVGDEMSKEMSGESTASAASSASADASSAAAESAATASEDPAEKLGEIENFATDELWNEGFCKVYNYSNDGKTKEGEKIDIDSTLSKLSETMKKIDEYDKYISGLSDSKYDEVRSAWGFLYLDATTLYPQVQAKKPVMNAKESDIIDVDSLDKNIDDFCDQVDKVLG